MSVQNNKRCQFNAFQIKMFMAMLMVLDHLPYIPGLVPPLLVSIFHAVTRCVGVWFAFNAVEGFLHTRSQSDTSEIVWLGCIYGGWKRFDGSSIKKQRYSY